MSAPPTSQEPAVRHLLDSVTFVPWMSRMQKKLVGLIQVNGSRSIPHPEASPSCIWGTAGKGMG